MTLPATAAQVPAADIDRYAVRGPRPGSAANQPHVAGAVNRRNRQTDGRTPDRYVDPPPHTVRAASIMPAGRES